MLPGYRTVVVPVWDASWASSAAMEQCQVLPPLVATGANADVTDVQCSAARQLLPVLSFRTSDRAIQCRAMV